MSLRLRDRNKPPPNGFQFFQAETGFDLVKACPICRYSFAKAVDAIRKHRSQNPRFKLSTDPTIIANELDVTNALRVAQMRNAESYIVSDTNIALDAPPKLQALRTGRPAAAGGGGVLPKMVAGIGTIVDWLGDGGEAVPAELANARAATCASCKWNDQGDWTRFFTAPVSEGIRRHLGIRKDMGLGTPHDDRLSICEICACPMKLKVHVPISYIRAKEPQSVREDLAQNAPWCWMNHEQG